MTRGKLFLLTTVLLTVISFGIFAGGSIEKEAVTPADTTKAADTESADEQVELHVVIAALKGPSGFAAAKMISDNFQPGANVTAEYLLVASPLEAVTRMTSGEVDAAFLPVNTAAKLYTKGIDYKLAAVSGLGSLFILSTDPEVRDWADLKGKTIYLTGKGATPDYLLRYLLIAKGLNPETDVTFNFTSAPPQIIQLMSAGKADTAFLPQPFAMLAGVQTGAETVLDPQKALMEIRGTLREFPFTGFVISERLIKERPEAATALTAALNDSIVWVKQNPEPASVIIEELGIMGAAIAKTAIPVSGIEFVSATDAKTEVNDFLKMLIELDPVSVGGQMPDEGFYFEN